MWCVTICRKNNAKRRENDVKRHENGAKHCENDAKHRENNAKNAAPPPKIGGLDPSLVLDKVKEKNPSLFNLLWQAYSTPSHLFYRGEIISSDTGIQQGDPGGPALFSLGIDHIIKKLKCEVNLWYLDDSNLAYRPKWF